jgi:hypothetical protein
MNVNSLDVSMLKEIVYVPPEPLVFSQVTLNSLAEPPRGSTRVEVSIVRKGLQAESANPYDRWTCNMQNELIGS